MPMASSAALEATVPRIASIGRCGTPSFSPDGGRFVFISDLDGRPQVWTVATGGGWPEQVTASEDPVQAVSWSPAGQHAPKR